MVRANVHTNDNNVFKVNDAWVAASEGSGNVDLTYLTWIIPFVAGVSECIIMGIPMNIGTGMFKLLHKYPFVKN